MDNIKKYFDDFSYIDIHGDEISMNGEDLLYSTIDINRELDYEYGINNLKEKISKNGYINGTIDAQIHPDEYTAIKRKKDLKTRKTWWEKYQENFWKNHQEKYEESEDITNKENTFKYIQPDTRLGKRLGEFETLNFVFGKDIIVNIPYTKLKSKEEYEKYISKSVAWQTVTGLKYYPKSYNNAILISIFLHDYVKHNVCKKIANDQYIRNIIKNDIKTGKLNISLPTTNDIMSFESEIYINDRTYKNLQDLCECYNLPYAVFKAIDPEKVIDVLYAAFDIIYNHQK